VTSRIELQGSRIVFPKRKQAASAKSATHQSKRFRPLPRQDVVKYAVTIREIHFSGRLKLANQLIFDLSRRKSFPRDLERLGGNVDANCRFRFQRSEEQRRRRAVAAPEIEQRAWRFLSFPQATGKPCNTALCEILAVLARPAMAFDKACS